MQEPRTATSNESGRRPASASRSSGAILHDERWLMEARPRLRRLARLRGVAPDAVEDVVQETLLEAWKHLDRLHTPQGIDPWLDEICRNICRRHARVAFRDRRHLTPLLTALPPGHESPGAGAPPLLHELPDERIPDPLDALDHADRARLLDRALAALPAPAREVVERCYLLEEPQRETAARLGLSLSALEARLHRARRQLRDLLNGPLRADAEALGLMLDRDGGWRETRLWCPLCGRRRLMGLFLSQPDGSNNLHMRCPDCEPRSGLADVDGSNVHSKGLIRLDGLSAFRPAWKRTMQGISERFTRALASGGRACPYCGAVTALQLVESPQPRQKADDPSTPDGLSRHPYQFWVRWTCPSCHGAACEEVGIFAACDLVYWSDPHARRFMADHPRWVSAPELLVDYAGSPALRLQMADVTTAARLTVLAHRETLLVLAVF
jgi:RNA polymerase sigma factor (sigma-70 family)